MALTLGMANLAADQQKPLTPPTQTHHEELHQGRFVTVDGDTRVEVLEWGGRGRPLVFLSGLGNTAHVFDSFAPTFRDQFRSIGLTRRGFGASSRPSSGYDVPRLSQDVIEVISALRLERPILIGHSVAGDEMSYIAVRYPERIGGLVYLDAAYDRTGVELTALWKEWPPSPEPSASDRATRTAYQAFSRRTRGYELPEAELDQFKEYGDPPPSVPRAIASGALSPDYTRITVPALALYAMPRSVRHLFPGYEVSPLEVRPLLERFWPKWAALVQRERDRFRSEVRHGSVIELDGASHYVFLSNRDTVANAVRRFLNTLGRTALANNGLQPTALDPIVKRRG
jgi:pimeloyl-ACP methyl ester carboxylesterase